jgi:hypothetical protein
MKTQSIVTALAAVAWVWSGQARADESPAASSQPSPAANSGRDIHAGVNFRTDMGARYYRADFGLRLGKWDAILVVDPLGVSKGDYDFDAVLRYVGSSWSVWGGGRLSITPIGRESQYTEKALVGVSAQLPSLATDRVRIHAGLELAVHVRAHGADIMSRWVCVDSPDCREDHFVFGLFGRVEYASAL